MGILVAIIVAAAVPVGFALARESGQAVDLPALPVTFSARAWWSSMSDGVLLAIAGGLFRGVAAVIRKAS